MPKSAQLLVFGPVIEKTQIHLTSDVERGL